MKTDDECKNAQCGSNHRDNQDCQCGDRGKQRNSVQKRLNMLLRIHHEITGVHGIMLNMLAKQRPEYIEAADTIAASSAVTTLLRCPGIKDGDNTVYTLTKEGTQPSHWSIDRAGIAQCMADLIEDESKGVNESLGITN